MSSSINVGDLTKKSVLELEEMLARERYLLKKIPFLQKLPDQGAKLKEKVVKIEEQLKSRRSPNSVAEILKKRAEVEKLEWQLRSLSSSGTGKQKLRTQNGIESVKNEELDSDDDEEENAGSSSDDDEMSGNTAGNNSDGIQRDEQMVFKTLATSQISQNQPKPSVPDSTKKPIIQDGPLYVKKLTEFIEHREPAKTRFVLNRLKPEGSGVKNGHSSPSPGPSFVSCPSPVQSNSSSKEEFKTCSSVSDSDSNVGKKARKWDESLVPVSSNFKAVKPLSFEESFQLTKEQTSKIKELDLKQQAERRRPPFSLTDLPLDAFKSAAFTSASFRVRFPSSTPRIKEVHDEPLEESDIDSEESDITDDEDTDSSAGESDDEAKHRSDALSRLVNTSLKI